MIFGSAVVEKLFKKKQGTGWTNLMTHIRAQHENQPEAKTSQMTLNFMHCKKSENLYGWLEWVCINLKPFSFVEDELTRKYTKLENVSRNTLERILRIMLQLLLLTIVKLTRHSLACVKYLS